MSIQLLFSLDHDIDNPSLAYFNFILNAIKIIKSSFIRDFEINK